MNIKNLIERLRIDHSNSENPRSFEKDLTEAFIMLGFKAEAKGGSDDCDVLIHHDDEVIILDAKTTKQEVISEGFINFEAMDRYKEKYKAQTIAIVAKGFSEGNIRKTAEKKGVILIETEAICKALENHAIYPYNANNLYENIFKRRLIVTSNDIVKSTISIDGQISILSNFFEAMKKGKTTAENIQDIHSYFRLSGFNFSLEEISATLDILCKPPFSILRRQENTYELLLSLEEMWNKLGILFSVKGLEIPGPPPPGEPPGNGKKKITAGDFEHEGKGIYVLKKIRNIKIDVNKRMKDVKETVSQNKLSVHNFGNFYYALRKKAGLI